MTETLAGLTEADTLAVLIEYEEKGLIKAAEMMINLCKYTNKPPKTECMIHIKHYYDFFIKKLPL